MSFENIAPYLGDPLVLTGFALFLFFGFARSLVKAGVIGPLGGRGSERVLVRILSYGFILALAIAVLGFGLKYRELSQAEQERAVANIKDEVTANHDTMKVLALNLATILEATKTVSEVVRHQDIQLMSAMFPLSNIDLSLEGRPSMVVAREALESIESSGLLSDEIERIKLNQAGAVVVGTIERTLSTIENLSDKNGERYVVSDAVWHANIGVARKISVADVTQMQSFYTRLLRTRAEYNLVTNGALEYLDSVKNFLDFENGAITIPRLATVLASERQFYSIATAFGERLAEDMETLNTTANQFLS